MAQDAREIAHPDSGFMVDRFDTPRFPRSVPTRSRGCSLTSRIPPPVPHRAKMISGVPGIRIIAPGQPQSGRPEARADTRPTRCRVGRIADAARQFIAMRQGDANSLRRRMNRMGFLSLGSVSIARVVENAWRWHNEH